MKRWVAAVALAALSVIGMPAVAASADVDACDDSSFAHGAGYEIFDVESRFLPPPLRGSGWDCAVRLADRPFDEHLTPEGGYLRSVQFVLIYADMTYDRMVGFYRDWESQGYADGSEINIISSPATGSVSVAFGADDIAGLDPRPGFVNARFSNPADVPPPNTPGSNIYEFTWADGVDFTNSSGISGRPSMFASVILTEPVGRGTGIADPTTLSDLPTIAQAAPTPVGWGIIGAGSLMLMLVVGWPSALLNSVVGSRYQAIVHTVTTRFRRKGKDAAPGTDGSAPVVAGIRTSRLPGWLMWPGFALAAILGSFVDPDFGFNAMSARLVLTLFLGFVLFNLGTWEVVRRVARRVQPESDPYLRFRWGSLVIVIVAVLVARLLGLDPGVIFGLVAGIAFAASLRAANSALVTIVGSAFGLALALVAWVAYSFLAPIEWGGNVAMVFAVEFLAGVTVKGVSTLPLSLLPLGNLDGAKLFGWKKVAWGASYAAGLAAFILVLATVPKSWDEIPDFLRWLSIFGAYAVVAIVVWAVNARMLKKRPLPPEKEQGDQPDAITID